MAERDATDIRVILMTAPDEETAEELVRTLVGEGLAACGTLVPGVRSIYRWQGAVESTAETMIVLKASAASEAAAVARVSAIHPYEVPEILVLPVLAGHEPYLAWVRSAGSA